MNKRFNAIEYKRLNYREQEVELKYIKRNPLQPRVEFDQSDLESLAENIKQYGLLQPILVRKLSDQEYIIVSGERRFRAHQLIKASTIRANVIECDDKTAYELTMLENLQRRDLNLLEEARGYSHLVQAFDYSLDQLSLVSGKSKSSIVNIMAILKEPKEVRRYVKSGILTLAAFVWLKQLPTLEEKLKLLKKLENEEIKRTQVREYVQKTTEAHRLAAEFGIREEDLKLTERKGKPGRFDFREEVIPADLKFFYILDASIETRDLIYLPVPRVLITAYDMLHQKSALVKFCKMILFRRDYLKELFMDSGAYPAAKRQDWGHFDKVDALFDLYEKVKPDICTGLDVPMYPFVLKHFKGTEQDLLDKTFNNLIRFRDWKPSFSTVKVFPLQGATVDQYIMMAKKYVKNGFFQGKGTAAAIGGKATATPEEQLEIVKQVVSIIGDQVEFIHCFGIGNPQRIVNLYKAGARSFDATTVILMTAFGLYWLKDGTYQKHIIQESPLARKVRLYFNMASFWGQLADQFAKDQKTPLTYGELTKKVGD